MAARRVHAVATCSVLTAGAMALVWHAVDLRRSAPQVDFNRDIRPILNQNCALCHGGVRQLGNVSFVYREEALGKGKSGRPTIVPGNARVSELFARVTSRDPAVRMPYHAPPLQPKQIELLRQWINEGAPWENHWAFVAPKPQVLARVHELRWVRQPLDRFVLARLEKEGLRPSSEASKEELLRRVSFDLTGLPPTREEVAAFLADTSVGASSGLLNPTIGGPSVMPPQPPGIWASVYNDSKWIDATGPDRYRRAIYTFIKRSAIYPSFVTFDAAPHDVSVARRIPTDTPLQALVTLNDPVYSEAAAALARRMLAIGPSGSPPLHSAAGGFNRDAALDKRLIYAARGLLSRDLSNQERTTLHALYGRLRAESLRSPSVGLRSRKDQDLVVYTSIASVLMNLDAALTR